METMTNSVDFRTSAFLERPRSLVSPSLPAIFRACFAGIWTNWTSVRTVNNIHAFLTMEPNAEIGAIHPKAMPVFLTTPEEVEIWLTASPDEP
jgi:putative SOS response-associated peptidase YedK